MAITGNHFAYHQAIMNIPGFLSSPVLMCGVQEIFGSEETFAGFPDVAWGLPQNPTVREMLIARGFEDTIELDFADTRAGMLWDLNEPVPADWHNRFNTLWDIGTIEHVANTHQAMDNYLRMLRVGGHVCIHTPVKGAFMHGLHTFNPNYIIGSLKQNGCEIVYCEFSTMGGEPLSAIYDDHGELIRLKWVDTKRTGTVIPDALIWVVARKIEWRVPHVAIQQLAGESCGAEHAPG